MAAIFLEALIAETGWRNRSFKSRENNEFYILRKTNFPAILTENGFYDNKDQCKELLEDSTRQKIAIAHVKAIFEMERQASNSVIQSKIDTTTKLNDSLSTSEDVFQQPAMVYIPGGTFRMGCTEDQDGDECKKNEKPAHQVTISDFYMGKYEVTNEEFLPFLIANGNQEEGGKAWVNLEGSFKKVSCGILQTNGKFMVKPGHEKLPMIYVSWYGARAYAAWLSTKTGKKYRLPSEAEWEYAARGGRKNQRSRYAGSNDLEEVAWYDANSNDQTHKVGTKKGNELDLYDMTGNVGEWIEDCWNISYDGAPKDGAAWTEGKCSYRVFRGGSWGSFADYSRLVDRLSYTLVSRYNTIGFRVVHNK